MSVLEISRVDCMIEVLLHSPLSELEYPRTDTLLVHSVNSRYFEYDTSKYFLYVKNFSLD